MPTLAARLCGLDAHEIEEAAAQRDDTLAQPFQQLAAPLRRQAPILRRVLVHQHHAPVYHRQERRRDYGQPEVGLDIRVERTVCPAEDALVLENLEVELGDRSDVDPPLMHANVQHAAGNTRGRRKTASSSATAPIWSHV